MDGNGVIDRREFRRALRALGIKAPFQEMNELFDALDADRDGQLAIDEIEHGLEDRVGSGGSRPDDRPSVQDPAKGVDMEADDRKSDDTRACTRTTS